MAGRKAINILRKATLANGIILYELEDMEATAIWLLPFLLNNEIEAMVPKINFVSGLAEEDMLRLTISISLEEIATTHFALKKDGSLGRDRLPQKQEVGLDVPSNTVQKMLKPWDSARITSTKSPYGWIGSGIDTTAETLCGWSRLTQAPLGHGLNYYAIEIGSTMAFYSHC
ncbi:hypothetical protein QJS10_CPA06g00609 [Acorus calamus]|uniref:Uncharacterized protein n=1 Tax=Acorus calamus TaxID=4465 RepID=A0AAV9EJX5_ACOCL|nr:hypothetical protein QJS10_CPA06g00609 [Acorus calamus]